MGKHRPSLDGHDDEHAPVRGRVAMGIASVLYAHLDAQADEARYAIQAPCLSA
jgi:hypothetical protein